MEECRRSNILIAYLRVLIDSARLFRMHCAELNNGGVMSDNQQQGSSMAGYKICLHPDVTEMANATIDHFVSLALP